jgi:hypothetical protein
LKRCCSGHSPLAECLRLPQVRVSSAALSRLGAGRDGRGVRRIRRVPHLWAPALAALDTRTRRQRRDPCGQQRAGSGCRRQRQCQRSHHAGRPRYGTGCAIARLERPRKVVAQFPGPPTDHQFLGNLVCAHADARCRCCKSLQRDFSYNGIGLEIVGSRCRLSQRSRCRTTCIAHPIDYPLLIGEDQGPGGHAQQFGMEPVLPVSVFADASRRHRGGHQGRRSCIRDEADYIICNRCEPLVASGDMSLAAGARWPLRKRLQGTRDRARQRPPVNASS